MKNFSFIFLLFISTNIFSQDSLTVEDAIRSALEHNYGVVISKNEIEIGKINNNWANAGAIPVISATATKTIGSNNIRQQLNTGSSIEKNGATTQNLSAGVNVNWRVFDGFKMFAAKHRLEELERNGEYAFRRVANQTVYDVVTAYYNIVKSKQQLKATIQQIKLYEDRLRIADMKYQIGSGAKYELLQAQVDYNEQLSNQLSLKNSIAISKSNLSNLIGRNADTSYTVADSIILKSLPDFATVQGKIQTQNPDVLLANSDLEILLQTRKEINANRLPAVTLNGNYNFVKSSNGAGLTLFNQSYGPSGSIGLAVPLFNGGLVKKQLKVNDIQVTNQKLTTEQLRHNLNTSALNAFINYQNALNTIALEKTNVTLAQENVFIASERFRMGSITTVELRQVQTSLNDAQNRLYNALLQAKLAEAEVGLLTGDISNL